MCIAESVTGWILKIFHIYQSSVQCTQVPRKTCKDGSLENVWVFSAAFLGPTGLGSQKSERSWSRSVSCGIAKIIDVAVRMWSIVKSVSNYQNQYCTTQWWTKVQTPSNSLVLCDSKMTCLPRPVLSTSAALAAFSAFFSRNAMSNWSSNRFSPRQNCTSNQSVFSTNLQISWALMDSMFQEKMMGTLINGLAVAFV